MVKTLNFLNEYKNQNKKLNLNKYAYLNYLKGDVFAWLNCDDNFQMASKEDEKLRMSSPWRFEFDEEDISQNERYDIPDQIKEGLLVSNYSEIWAKNKFPNHDVVYINKSTNLENLEYTKQALENYKNVIIFEATFTYNDFFIRTDILVKTESNFKVIEVKAVTYPNIIHGLDLFFQKSIVEKGNKEYSNWEYSLLIVNNEFINKKTYDDNKKANYALVNVDYIGSSKSKPTKKIEDEGTIKWSISQNEYFMKDFKEDEFISIDLNPSNKKKRMKGFTFSIKDFFKSDYVSMLHNEFDNYLENIKKIQLLDEPPLLELDKKNNEFMKSNYLNWAIYNKVKSVLNYDKISSKDETVFDISGLFFDIKLELFHDNIILIKDVPNQYLCKKGFNLKSEKNTTPDVLEFLKKYHGPKGNSGYNKIIQKHFSGTDEKLIHKEGIEKALKDYEKGPIYMYDFETANLAIPETDGARPYEQVVYQYSIHVILDPQDFDFQTMKNIVHYEWLAEDRNNFSTQVWKEFIKVFKKHGKGKYVAWNMSFEKGCIKRSQISDLSDDDIDFLHEIGDDTIDLMLPFRAKYYYHSDFHGSYSIKAVGPHFASEINYKNLNNVQKGDQSAAFAKKWLRDDSKESENDWLKIREDMLKYCEYDTLLMVAILQRLREVIYD